MKTPADIIAKLLEDLNLIGNEWPVSVSMMPDVPDQAITTYDTAGEYDGRLMSTGERIKHPGIQVRVRGPVYPDTWSKAESISLGLASQRSATVDFGDGDSYLIANISQRGEILPMGQEGDSDRRRYNFTINLVITHALKT